MIRGALIALVVAGCGRWSFESHSTDGGPGGDGDAAIDAAIDAPIPPNVAFMSSMTYPATFGGVAFADSECQRLATVAGKPGTFVAMLGSSARAPDAALAGSRGWTDATGAPIVNQPSGWLDGSMFHALRRDENGLEITGEAWLGTLENCGDWTSAAAPGMGSIVNAATAFGSYTVTQCGATARLVCVQTGHVAVVAGPTQQGRRMFLSTASWTPAGGLAGADAFCATDAAAHGVSGTFRALLATSTMPNPFARFSTAGATWTRLDGQPLTPTAAALATAATLYLDAFALYTSSNTHYPYGYPWTGTAAANCTDWTTAAAAISGSSGAAAAALRSQWLRVVDASCDVARPLLCFEP